MANRSRIFIFGSVLTPIALYFGASMTMDHFERQGGVSSHGQDIVTNLGSIAKAVQSKDVAALESSYAKDFSGSPLGLTRLEQTEEKDGVRKLTFRSDGGSTGRGAAVGEWRITLPASIRLKKPACMSTGSRMGFGRRPGGQCAARADRNAQGAPAIRIDRAYFRMHFDTTGAGSKSAGGLDRRRAHP